MTSMMTMSNSVDRFADGDHAKFYLRLSYLVSNVSKPILTLNMNQSRRNNPERGIKVARFKLACFASPTFVINGE